MPSIGMGADGLQAAVEAVAGGAHGFCVVLLSLSLFHLFILVGLTSWSHKMFFAQTRDYVTPTNRV
jgi:hypothetical protein